MPDAPSMPGGETSGQSVPAHAWKALTVAAAGYVLFGFNSTATNLAFESITNSFPESSEATVAWVASGYFIASAAFLPLGGRLADRVGRRKIFNVGLVGFVLSALASAVAPTVLALIAARTVQAISGALVIPSSLAMVLPEFPKARRASAVATWAAAGPLSAAIAPSTAAALLQISSWRLVYFLSAPLALVALALSFVFVSDSKEIDDEARLDVVGTGMAVVSLGALILGIGQGPIWGWADARTMAAIVGSSAIAVLFFRRSSRHPAPLLNLSLLRIPEVALANLANLFMSTTSLSAWLIWPLWLGRVWGYTTAQIGLAITPGPICAGFATLAGGRFADRYGQRWLMIGGSGLATFAILWSFLLWEAEPNYLVTFLPTVVCFGLGWGVSNPSMNSYALSHVPQAVLGEMNATFNTVRNLGAALGVAASVAIVGSEDRVDVLEAYDRVNLFFASWVGMSCLSLTVGTLWIAGHRTSAGADLRD